MRTPGNLVTGAVLLALFADTLPLAAQQTDGEAAVIRELGERAQARQRRAVEELIDKLQQRPSVPKSVETVPATTAPTPTAPTPAVSPPTTVVATPPPSVTPSEPAAPATATLVPPATPAAQPTIATTPASPAESQVAPVTTTAAAPAAVTSAAPAVEAVSTGAPSLSPAAPQQAVKAAVTPPTEPVVAEAERPSVDLEIYFNFASAAISPRSTEQLTVLGHSLVDPRLAGQTFLIAGYTDGKGKPDYNLRLSQQRADAVRDFLINDFKIEPKRLISKGFGMTRMKDASHPVADANRRVQIVNWTN